jgi:PAS domain S-box-containing protein
METMHSLLKRQLRRHFGDQFRIPAEWRAFLHGVDEAYRESDTDRAMLERSLELSSQEMLEANSEIRAVFQAIPDLVFRLNHQGVILDIKAGATDEFMIGRQDLIGKRLQETPLQHVAQQFEEAIQRVIAGNAPASFEYSAVRQGQGSDYEARLVPLSGEQIVVIIRNITERKQSLRLLGAAVEQAKESILITDAQLDSSPRKILFVNPAFTTLTGYPAREAIGQTLALLHGRGTDPTLVGRITQTLERGVAFEGEAIHYRKDGTEFSVELRIAPIRDASGKSTHLLIIQRDITERRRTEAALRESEARYRALFEGSADGIVIADSETKAFQYANPALCRMFGYTEAELRALGVAGIHPPESLPHVVAEFEAQARGEKTLAADLPCLRKDGSIFHADISATKITVDGRPCNVGLFRDITERKQAEATRRAGEKKYRGLFENTRDAIMTLEPPFWRFTSGNAATVKLFGAKNEEEYVSYGPAELSPERQPDGRASAEKAREMIETALREGSCFFEWTHQRIGGGEFPVDVLLTRIEQGGRDILLATVRDSTERKQAEAARQAGEKRLREINTLQSLLLHPNPLDQKLQFVTEAVVQMLGADFARIWMIAPGDRCAAGCIHAAVTEGPHVCRFREKCLHLLASSGRYTHTDGGHGRVPFGCYKIGKIAAGEESKFITNEAATDPRVHNHAWVRELGLVAFAGYRLADSDGMPIGVLALFSRQAISTEEDLLLEGIAHSTAQVLRAARAEEQLRQSEERFRQFADQSSEVIWFTELNPERILFINRMVETVWGLPPERFYQDARAWTAAIHPEDRSRVHEAWDACLQGRAPRFEAEYRIVRPDGSIRWVLDGGMPVRNTAGEIVRLSGVARDITERKQIETALAYERDLLRTLLDQSPDHIYFKDAQSRFIKTGQAIARVFGVATPEELAGKTDFDFFTEAHARATFEDEQEIIRTGVPLIGKVEKEVWQDGRTETWVLTTKMPFRDKDGQIVGTFGVSKDITAMKQAEERLRQLSRAVEQSPASIVITDPAGNITYVNPKFTTLTGYAFAEALGKNPRILKSGETPPAAYEQLWKTITAGREWRGEFHNKKKNGELYWELASISPIVDESGQITHFLAVKEDVTERKRVAEELFQAQKMETVGKLAGGIAHEFNSLLTAIIGQSESLIEKLPRGEPLGKSAAEIRRAADRAATLTRQLLAYGRKQFLHPEALDLNQVVTGMHGMLRHLMGGELVQLEIIPTSGLQLVRADAGQIEQVIMNLAVNARDAMPQGGKLILETANVTLDEQSLGRDPELKPGAYVMLAITDTGMGMSAEVQARIFEPFFTTKEVGQGSGLGLSTCHGIIKQSGGHITVYSELGRGTTFKIYLPQVEPRVKPAGPDALNLPGGTETILLVEDEAALREMAAGLLSRLGYTVLTAANGIEALSLRQQRETGRIDLLLTDAVMPHMSGRELADRVVVLFPSIRILFTSAYTENAIVHQGVLKKGVALLQKPFTPSALAHKLREVLDQSP